MRSGQVSPTKTVKQEELPLMPLPDGSFFDLIGEPSDDEGEVASTDGEPSRNELAEPELNVSPPSSHDSRESVKKERNLRRKG